MKRLLNERIAELFPGYFAMVMATGIVSVAASLEGITWFARALLWLNAPVYVVLVALTVARAIWHREPMARDLADHGRSPGFFTTVAGTCMLGTQLLVVQGDTETAELLWLAGAALWLVITYGFFTIVTVKEQKPPIQTGLNGSWLLAVVETQSIAVLGALLAPHQPPGSMRDVVLFVCLCMFFVGCLLYLVLITLILYRFIFFHLTPTEVAPPYWINMGAVAITTVAGASLLSASPLWPALDAMAPLLRGLTVAFWAIATWWIPLLIILGVWRHGYERMRITYDPQYWGLVFPLGMYTTATVRLAEILEIPLLRAAPRYFMLIAAFAWAATLTGLVHRLARGVRSARSAA